MEEEIDLEKNITCCDMRGRVMDTIKEKNIRMRHPMFFWLKNWVCKVFLKKKEKAV